MSGVVAKVILFVLAGLLVDLNMQRNTISAVEIERMNRKRSSSALIEHDHLVLCKMEEF